MTRMTRLARAARMTRSREVSEATSAARGHVSITGEARDRLRAHARAAGRSMTSVVEDLLGDLPLPDDRGDRFMN